MSVDDPYEGEDSRVIPIRVDEDEIDDEEGLKLPENPELNKALEEALASVEQREKKGASPKGADGMAQQERESLQSRIKDLHIKIMEKERLLEEKEKEIKNLTDQAARRQADLENYKKRVQKEKADQFNYGNEEIAREFLEVLDNLERALIHDQSNPSALLDGVELTRKLMEQTFKKFGVEPIEAMGRKFDPNLHQAIAQTHSPEHEPGTVIHEQQRGYVLKDRLLRPSMVVVAAAESGKPE